MGIPWHIAAHAEAVMPMRETHVLLDRNIVGVDCAEITAASPAQQYTGILNNNFLG